MKQEGKWRFTYFLIKRIFILLIEAILILFSYIGNLVNRPLLIILIICFAYGVIRLCCMIDDLIKPPIRKHMEYKGMKTGRVIGRWDSSKGKEIKHFKPEQWIYGKFNFHMEDKPYGYMEIYWTIDSLLRLINSRIFIDSKIRMEWLKGLRLREETGILKGYLKGNVVQELAEKEGMAEVIYYPYSGIIKEVKVVKPKNKDHQVEVWHQWNKRYEYMQMNHIRDDKAFDLIYEGLKRLSNGKTIYWNYSEKSEFQKLKFQELENKEIKEKIRNEKEVYVIISRPEDKLTLDSTKKAQDQMLERQIWDRQLYALIHFYDDENVEIMGIVEIKTIKWLMKECRSRGYDVHEV